LRQPFPVLLVLVLVLIQPGWQIRLEEVLGAVVALFNEIFGTIQQVNLGESRTSMGFE
jgi:hypothetical protein